MTTRIVLDAAGLTEVATSPRLRALLQRASERGHDTWCSAVTVAEVARGSHYSALARQALRQRGAGAPIRLQPADRTVAFLVGALLHDSGRDSADIADAHVVATCASCDAAVVVTSDPDDIVAIGSHLAGVRIVTRRPDASTN